MRKIKNVSRVLITSPHGLGDFIAKIPFIRRLKELYPDCEIILCARKYIKELVGYVAEINHFIDFDELFCQKEEEIVKQLKDLKLDVVVHLLSVRRNLGPHVLMYAQKAGISQRIGNIDASILSFLKKRNEHFITHNIKKKRIIPGVHEFEWNLFPLRFFEGKEEESTVEMEDLLKASNCKTGSSPYLKEGFNLIIHPGSHGNAKEWPQQNYLKLIEELKGEGIHILITGSSAEKNRLKEIDIDENHVTNLMGKLSLKEFISLIRDVDGLIAASTGPIHIASLFSTPTLGLFSKQAEIGPKVWRPRGKNAIFLESSDICRACKSRLSEIDPTLCTCMDGIRVESVKEIIQNWRQSESLIR